VIPGAGQTANQIETSPKSKEPESKDLER